MSSHEAKKDYPPARLNNLQNFRLIPQEKEVHKITYSGSLCLFPTDAFWTW